MEKLFRMTSLSVESLNMYSRLFLMSKPVLSKLKVVCTLEYVSKGYFNYCHIACLMIVLPILERGMHHFKRQGSYSPQF